MKNVLSMLRMIRRIVFSLIAKVSLSSKNGKPIANHFTWLGRHCKIGSNCNFNGLRITGNGNVTIGDNFHSGEGCLFITSNHNYEGNALPYDETNIDKDIVIGRNVWLGSRVILLPGARIGDGCIIQAGSCVVAEIPPLQIAGGHPAKCFSKRDEKHYIELDKQKKYL